MNQLIIIKYKFLFIRPQKKKLFKKKNKVNKINQDKNNKSIINQNYRLRQQL